MSISSGFLFILSLAVGTQAAVYSWDGEASTSVFSDPLNWSPNGTLFTTADEYQISNGVFVVVSTNCSIGAFDLAEDSVLSIESDGALTVNQNNATDLSSGTVKIAGTLSFGANRWNTVGVDGQVTIDVEGVLTSTGNFYSGGQMNTEINVTGLFQQKLSSFGATLNGASPRVQRVRVLSGGVYWAVGGITLQAHENNETAVQLCGGTMYVSSGVAYTYTSLVMNGDDGIIFENPNSALVLEGDRSSDVASWIADGALSSHIGALSVQYDSGEDETVVTAAASTGTFIWDGDASTAVFSDPINWSPNGTLFATTDEYQIDSNAFVIIGSNRSIGGFDLDGDSVLHIEAGSTLTINENNATDLSSGTVKVAGTLDFGANRWNTIGVGEQVTIDVDGVLTSTGNFYSGGQMNTEINVTGLFQQKLSSFGATVGSAVPRVQRVRVLAGGVYWAVGGITLQAHENNETAVQLCGGTMYVPSGVAYIYSGLVINGDDGIIFENPNSALVLDGNRTNDVATWIDDGALSSHVGALSVQYDSGEDETVVSAAAATGPFIWDGGSTGLFDDTFNWTPAGAAFSTTDEFNITNGAEVRVAADVSIDSFDLSGDSLLTIERDCTLTVNQNYATTLGGCTLTVDGSLLFGSCRWDVLGVGETAQINVNGELIGSGNFYSGGQMNLRIDVTGLFYQKLSGFGATIGAAVPRVQVLSVNGGGTFEVPGGLTLRGHSNNETAIHLSGGVMHIESGVTYDYSSLPLNGNDGIIFKSGFSQLVLDGDRRSDVSTWISAGALSSECGTLQVSYDASEDITFVETDGWSGFQELGTRTPFWRVSGSVAPYSADGWRLTSIPDYLTTNSLSFPFEKRPYDEEIPGVDEVILIRLLGGLQDANGNPLWDEDFVYRENGLLICRPDVITARIQPYLDQGYTNFTIVLDNVNWCLPTVPESGTYGQRAPEASFDEWYVTVQSACVHLRNLLGEEAANRLKFRVGTESDWMQRWDGTETEFLLHYDYSAAAVKSILPDAQIGPYNELGGAKFSGTFGNVNYDTLACHCWEDENSKTGETGTPFDWANASFYFVQDAQDPDVMAACLNRFYQESEVYQPALSREVHEYGITADSTGLGSFESGARGAVMNFNALLNFTVLDVAKSTTWWRGELERFGGDEEQLMAGQLWSMHMLKQLFDLGELALLHEDGGSTCGTVRKAIAARSDDGTRLLIGVTAFNTNCLEQTAETASISLPKSFFTVESNPVIQWIKYDRSTAIYDVVRDDLDTEGLLTSAYDVSYEPVSQLFQMTSAAGKNYIYQNWTSGKNYRDTAQGNLNLVTTSQVSIDDSDPDEYVIEFTMAPDTVIVLDLPGD